ncbi:thermostable beta-glucosidase B [mine drainage metagenome]|uniref:Thermostable beta-glucosidase B n=1 Tax=mine drainage metagenome TaxID=410659 RepID=A0A1J5NZ08_9ZZZZ
MTASFEVRNTGAVAGIETAQVYARVAGGQRLIGWARVALNPGEARRVSVEADPRLLASYDVALPGWRVAAGAVEVTVGPDAATVTLKGEAVLSARTMKP